jgi:hypothetical protein
MPAASEIVQFVDKVAVVPTRVKVQQQLAGGNCKYDHARAAKELQ